MELSNEEKLDLCQKVLDGLNAAKTLAKTRDSAMLSYILTKNDYSEDDSKDILFAVITAGTEGLFCDADFNLD
jgi:hypothetical protein